jgi:LytS/YehU family sensor histidine kinase
MAPRAAVLGAHVVENAMKHASPPESTARLEIEADLADDSHDKGLNTAPARRSPHGRVGLQNLRERLAAYGDNATLELRAFDACRVAELRIPAAWPESGLTSHPCPGATVTETTTTP